MKKRLLIILIILLQLNVLISADKSYNGLWINKDFLDCAIQHKSIIHCLKSLKVPIAFSIVASKEKKIRITETFDLHDSGFNDYYKFCDLNNIYLSTTKNNKSKFVKLDSNSLMFNSTVYILVSDKITDLSHLDKFLSREILKGDYLDLNSNDTITITEKALIINSKEILHFSLGIDYYDINYDYIIFNFEPGRIFEKSIYIFTFNDKELILYSVFLHDGEKYLPKEIKYRLLKIN